jgi:hypothetical protein
MEPHLARLHVGSRGGGGSGSDADAGGYGGGATDTDAEALATDEDADRLGFFGGDTLLPPVRCSVDGGGGGERFDTSALPSSSPGGAASGGSGGPNGHPHRAHDHEDAAAESRALPFEFRVLDAALDAVCTRLESDVHDVEAAATPALDALTQKVSKRNLEDVKRARGALARLQARVQTVRAELQRLLDDDSDMRDMYLSRKAAARAAALRLWLGMRAGGAPPVTPGPVVSWELDADDDADIQVRHFACVCACTACADR